VKRLSLVLATVLVLGATATLVMAQQPAAPAAAAAPVSKIDKGDTAWMLTSSALVLLMTAPGLALFYGGMVRQKNALATLMQSFIIMAIISVQWVLWGYSLAFAPDHGGIIGGLDWIGLRGVGGEPFDAYSKTIPHQAFMLFQMMFAIITPALITGAFAERKKFSAFLLFTVLWATVVYDPLAHWVWGDGGWLKKLGAKEIMPRSELDLSKIKPLDKSTWAGAVDNLGGEVLSWICSTMKDNGVIASIGLAASPSLNTTVMPFILRGARLLGINSGESSNDVRETVWRRLATDMKPPLLKEMARTVAFSELPTVFDDFINAKVTRRVVVDLEE